jgi:hypothetical protein
MRRHPGPRAEEEGLGLIGLLVSLAIIGILAVVAIKSLSGTTNSLKADTRTPEPEFHTTAPSTPTQVIASSADEVAQANLQAALTLADDFSLAEGGYGDISVPVLADKSSPGAFTSSASTRVSDLSVAAAGGAGGGVMFAARSADGACWLVWRSDTTTVFGVKRDHSPCIAIALPGLPALSMQPHTATLWQHGSFPIT